jgi:hypothetical protein
MLAAPDADVVGNPVKRLFDKDLVPVRETKSSAKNAVPSASAAQSQDDGFSMITYPSSPEGERELSPLEPFSAMSSIETPIEEPLLDWEDIADGFLLTINSSPTDITGDQLHELTETEISSTTMFPYEELGVSEDYSLLFNTSEGALVTTHLQSLALTPTSGRPTRNHQRPSNGTIAQRSERQSKRSRRLGMLDVSEDSCESLHTYLEKERLRCEERSTPGPFETFFKPEIQQELLSSGNDAYSNALQTICVTIASPESLVTLQHLLRCYRAGERSHTPGPAQLLSIKERVSVIGAIDQEVAYMCLLRRCHILELYEGNLPESSDGFVLSTQHTVAAQGPRTSGNPRQIAERNIRKTIMEQICPDMNPASREYRQNDDRIKMWRKLGQRLYMMKMRFGYGILGLLQYDWGIESALNITDKMYDQAFHYLGQFDV